MALQLVQHMHCSWCGQAIPFVPKKERTNENQTCSKACAAEWEDVLRKRKRNVYLLYVMIAFSIGLLMLTYLAPGLFG